VKLISAKSFQMNLDLFVRLLILLRNPLLKLRLLRPLRKVPRRVPRKLLRLPKLPKLLRPKLLRLLRRIVVYQPILLINVEKVLPFVKKDTVVVNMVTVESLMTTVRLAVVANLNLVVVSK